MVYITSGIRWGMAIWCAVAAAIVVVSSVQGAPPLALVLIAVATVGPLAVWTALTQFRPEARTAAQVLHDKAPKL